MRKTLLIIYGIFVTCYVTAQSVRETIDRNIVYSASNLLAYPTSSGKALTEAPKGYKPFYISHYGRHGSRHLISSEDYDNPYQTLLEADKQGKLTKLGKDVLKRILLLKNEATGRLGELTPLGAVQHREIAERMFKRFREVFAGKTVIDAKSTTSIRCILSMENELLEFARLNPQLTIKSDASEHDMYYMNLTDTALNNHKMPPVAKAAYKAFYDKHIHCDSLMQRLFNDTVYTNRHVNGVKLNEQLFKLASSVQNEESRSHVTLYDIFSKNEIYSNWLVNNAWWYINFGSCPLNGGTQPYSQRNLLKRIIEEADSCIKLPDPGATLRFGHDTMVLPLVCLMDINGYGKQISDLEQLESNGWLDFKVFPMGSNLQFIFYRKGIQDKDILVKVLLNEKEATLPLKSNYTPYYHWKDVRDFYLKKLAAYIK